MRIDVARQIVLLHNALDSLNSKSLKMSSAEFFLARPDLRGIAARVQMLANSPYGEIRGDLLSADLLPLNILRCKLSSWARINTTPNPIAGCVLIFAKAPPSPMN